MPRLPTIFVAGYPGEVGGAPTERWHTVKLWRRFGLGVTMIPTWRPTERWHRRLADMGVPTVRSAPSRLEEIPGLRGGIVVAFCNSTFLRHAHRFRRLRCRIVWVNCMTWLFEQERQHYRQWGPFDAYVFQSHYQRDKLQPQLAEFGVTPAQCHVIRGAFCAEEFPFRPLRHEPGEPLVIGRLSRSDVDKYSEQTWAVYGRIRHAIRARVMGWDQPIEQKLGPPPLWAECLATGTESAYEFLRKLHCLVQINGGAEENWPRVGLEAMAAGVPIVAENRWGWREMIDQGDTGFLCDDVSEFPGYVERLAGDESLRLAITHRARDRLVHILAEPQMFWRRWRRLFFELEWRPGVS